MLYDHGRHFDPYSRPYVKKVGSRRGTVERLLAKAGSVFVLPLHSGDPRESYLAQERNIVANGRFVKSVDLSRQADALFFITEASELRAR
jgi:hypothetical protein